MPSFAVALQQGIKAAENAEIAQREIDDVFNELDREVRAATAGNVAIKRDDESRIIAYRPNATGKRLLNLSGAIANYETGRGGYPVRLSWGNITHFCEDRVALANCLADMLRDPIVGRQISKLAKE